MKNLSEQQKLFLEALFQNKGNFTAAKRAAGYSENTNTQDIMRGISEENLSDAIRKYLNRLGIKAIVAIEEVLDEPDALGNQHRLAVAKDLLDRIGVVKKEKIEIDAKSPLFILPSKKESE